MIDKGSILSFFKSNGKYGIFAVKFSSFRNNEGKQNATWLRIMKSGIQPLWMNIVCVEYKN